jgi:hypothetical protein
MISMNSLARMIALAALAASIGAHAATPVALLTPVTFAPATDKREEVKQDCKLGDVLETRIGKALSRAGKGSPGTTTTTEGDVVKVHVLTIWGARGNNWTGPKGLVIHVDLLHDGAAQRSVELHRTTLGGLMGPFMGICGFMERDADSLGKDVAEWVRDATYTGDKSAPQATPVETAPASSASN